METEQKPKEYNFLTIEDIINNIHIGNKETFLTDFKSWLDIVTNTVQTVRMSIELGCTSEDKEKYKNVKNSDLVGCNSLKWIDDGKHNISINVTVV